MDISRPSATNSCSPPLMMLVGEVTYCRRWGENKKGVEDALSCTSAHAWDNYSPPVELRMTFRFPSSDHHTLGMSLLSRVMLNV